MKKPVRKKALSRRPAAAMTAFPEKLKQRLYPVVLGLFADNDFHQVNIREIYKKSGISPSTIYRYFPSKEDLLFAILDEKIGEIGVLVLEHIKGIESAREIFRKIFWVTMDYYDRNPGVAVTAFITVPMRAWMKVRSYRREDASVILAEVVKRARERGEIDQSIRTSQILDQYYMHCYRQIHLWYFNGMRTKLVDRIPVFFNVLWKTLSPPSSSRG
ncbi:MAG: TetR/AcrR family transcriptional regulator [Spirochaetes bacterium]|jgi:AcrR family transcriptional regulator|nr:TetR/AcrR family transcriptional regulator [Spirochaetota bacterium]